MSLIPFIGFFGVGEDTGAPRSPIARGPHELSVRPWGRIDHLETRALPEGPGLF
ncbi:unnamed protein product [Staurois parvus]|uniref:Uncharacterized protein n=1 Tax=Staurois parvus TaxID=386267 RepID=A0ABN9CPH5_9NEOB|nr:unnamed protein product [Staurois parvus]